MSKRREAALASGKSDYRAKHDQIIATGAVVFRERGYRQATLNDVAERLGVDRASLYYYFGSKEELFHAVIREVIDENLRAGEEIVRGDGNARDKLAALINLILSSYDRHYPYVYVYIQEDMSQIANEDAPWAVDVRAKTRRIERLFLSLISDGVAEGLFRSDLSTTLAANAIFGMISWTHRWHVPGRHYNAQELADTFTSIFFEGVARPT